MGDDNVNAIYMCIDLKTFYASVECVERGLDPFETNLVVADPARGKGAICLAISPQLKKQGVRNRCRVFEIPSHIDFITALPRMSLYMQYSADIYAIYLKYIAKEDIHVYSIDEAFLDITHYLQLYQMDAKQLASMILNDIYENTGITATVGIGTNLYLAKIALDISAKHVENNMGFLNEELYRKTLWHHQPLTDFWQVGRGIVKQLAKYGIKDMYDIAHFDEKILYREFGINAEYLIDHALGLEPTTITDIKQYESKEHSISNHQILFEEYEYQDARLVLKEMVELTTQQLVEQHLVSDHIGLYIGYAKDTISSTGGSKKLSIKTNSYQLLVKEFLDLYQKTTDQFYPIKRIGVTFGNVVDEMYEVYDLFTDVQALEKERQLQKTLIDIKHKYGKNAILKGMNVLDKATTRKRNLLIGGHNAQ